LPTALAKIALVAGAGGVTVLAAMKMLLVGDQSEVVSTTEYPEL